MFERSKRNDPLYLGLRRSRIRGAEYDAFVDQFCDLVREMYPQAMLHFEDFGVANASRLLKKFRPKQSCCKSLRLSLCFGTGVLTTCLNGAVNDDMQGTAAVVLSALVSACRVTKTELKDQRIALFGVGELESPSPSFETAIVRVLTRTLVNRYGGIGYRGRN